MIENVTLEDVLRVLPGADNHAHPTQLVADCPFCGKKRHLYMSKKTFLWDCKRCGEEGNLLKILNILGEEDLLVKIRKIGVDYTYSVKLLGTELKSSEHPEEGLEKPPIIKFPIGTQNIQYGDKWFEYLVSERQFSKDFILERLHLFQKNKIMPSLKTIILISVREDEQLVGYVGRNMNPDAEPRYKNSKGTNFKNLLLGIDEVKEGNIVALGEGAFDKYKFDLYKKQYGVKDIDSVCSFGKKLNERQIYRLKEKRVDHLIFFWDFDAIPQIKSLTANVAKEFRKVEVVLIDRKLPNGEYQDLGASSPKEIDYFLHIKRKEIYDFFYSKVQIRPIK